MNIIYLLTNTDRKEGQKRFYIGGKCECRLEVIDGVSTIIDIKTERPYLGSSTSHDMKQDIQAGHKFSASILKSGVQRSSLLEEENKLIRELDAVESGEFYNLSYATIGGYMYDHTAIMNFFGETIKDYASSKSGISKRTSTAKKLGFKSIGDFCLFIHNCKEEGVSYYSMSNKLKCERHTPINFIRNYNIKKFVQEVLNKCEEVQHTVRDMYTKGASCHKIQEVTGLEIPTISIYLEGFDEGSTKEYLTARRKNLTEDELQLKIIQLYIKGKSVKECAKELGINSFSAVRYFDKYVRSHLKVE